MSNEAKLSRRLVLKQSLALGVVTAGSFGILATACGKKELSCDDTSSLPPADAQTRTLLAYVDKSPEAAKNCANCQQYKAAAENQCGGCNLVKGPINPKGYCKSWAAKVGGLPRHAVVALELSVPMALCRKSRPKNESIFAYPYLFIFMAFLRDPLLLRSERLAKTR